MKEQHILVFAINRNSNRRNGQKKDKNKGYFFLHSFPSVTRGGVTKGVEGGSSSGIQKARTKSQQV